MTHRLPHRFDRRPTLKQNRAAFDAFRPLDDEPRPAPKRKWRKKREDDTVEDIGREE